MMGRERGSDVIQNWPEESREAAQLVIDEHGEPHEVTDSMLVWHHAGPRERIVATRMFFAHNFPARTSMRSSRLSTTGYRSRCSALGEVRRERRRRADGGPGLGPVP
jgi:hypothetical protein